MLMCFVMPSELQRIAEVARWGGFPLAIAAASRARARVSNLLGQFGPRVALSLFAVDWRLTPSTGAVGLHRRMALAGREQNANPMIALVQVWAVLAGSERQPGPWRQDQMPCDRPTRL